MAVSGVNGHPLGGCTCSLSLLNASSANSAGLRQNIYMKAFCTPNRQNADLTISQWCIDHLVRDQLLEVVAAQAVDVRCEGRSIGAQETSRQAADHLRVGHATLV